MSINLTATHPMPPFIAVSRQMPSAELDPALTSLEPDAPEGQEPTPNTRINPRNFQDQLSLSHEAEAIRQLQMRDREVRTHEAAHAAVGGRYSGHPSFQYQRGPDGRSYAVGGEVSIDTSAVPGDPVATLQKAEQIRAAALAPARPSAQDMRVAQKAQRMAAQARTEMVEAAREELTASLQTDENDETPALGAFAQETPAPPSASSQNSSSAGRSRLTLYA